MKTFAIAFAVIAVLAAAFTASVFPQENQNLHHSQMFIQEKMIERQHGLRPYVPGSHNEELFRNELGPCSPLTFDRVVTKPSKFLSDTMYFLIYSEGETWDTIGNVWRVATKDTLTYDSNGNEREDLGRTWSNGEWVNQSKETFAYDANGNETGNLGQMWSDGAWVNLWKNTFMYNADGQKTGDVYQMWNDSVWVNQSKETFTYDAYGKETGYVYQDWNDSIWVNGFKDTIEYDANGRMMEAVFRGWNDSMWVIIQKDTIAYGANGKEAGFVYQMWSDSVWVNQSKETFTYDANGNETGSLAQTWSGSAWVNEWEYTDAYDENGNRKVALFQMWNGNAWVNQSKETFTWQILVTDVNEKANALGGFALSVNYPNPSNPQTKISFSVPKESYIILKVYDLLGREIATLAQGKKEVGEYSVLWNAATEPSGIYFYRLEATNTGDPKKNFTQVKKMLLLK